MRMENLCVRVPKPLLRRLTAIAAGAPDSASVDLSTVRHVSDVVRRALVIGVAQLERVSEAK